jgi:hypothetical protein
MMALLRSEWTKFRTVRGWLLAAAAAGAAILALGLYPGMQGSCGRHGPASECVVPVGPTGVEVTDSFTFLHKPLTGDGRITARLAALSGRIPSYNGDLATDRAGLVPWAKAGLIIKANTSQGSAYAAVMLTGGHGTRMQVNYTRDTAGTADVGAGTPRWLRLTRTGGTITGEESADGSRWTTIGTATLADLPSTVEIGLFATSPQFAETVAASFGSTAAASGPSEATATFDRIDRSGPWTTTVVGESPNGPRPGHAEPTADGYAVTGSGDIAPAVAGPAGIGTSLTQTLVGTFIGLVILVVVATMFVTAEYRRGLIRTTLAASPRRGAVLAAKAAVAGGVAFVVGTFTAAVVIAVGPRVLRASGTYVHAATTSTQLRLVAGTAVLLALGAVLGLAIGTLLRRSAPAIATAVVLIVLPYLLALTVLPAVAGDWLLRVTPAAAFAIQQATPRYHQVDNLYLPTTGYFPLPPWAGLAVLLAWTAVGLMLAAVRLSRSDA